MSQEHPHMSETEWAFANLGAPGLNTDGSKTDAQGVVRFYRA